MSGDSNTEGLEPISTDQRTMGLRHYSPVWWASLIVVQSFAVAFFAVYPQGNLNLAQVIIAALIGSTALAIFFVLNGFPGYEKGIPFSIQTRSAFGIKGASIPNYLRIAPAIAWLGIGNWIGALAINTITTTLWGFGNLWIYFFGFLILNVAIAVIGIDSIKWFDSIASGVIIVLMTYTAYIVLTSEGIPTGVITHEGSWSLEFVAVIAVMVGQVITGAINVSDLSRHLEVKGGARNHILGHFGGIVPPYLFMLLIGILFGATTGNPDPIEAVMDVAPTAAIGALMLLFVVLAQISTNLTMNLLPPTHVFQDSLGVSWKTGVILTGILSIATFPWVLFTSDVFFTFIAFYSAFLGPVLGVMIADYWIVRKRDTDIDALYDKSVGSKFWYIRGFSVTSIVSITIGVAVSFPVLDFAWMIGLPVGLISYVVLKKVQFDRHVASYITPEKELTSEAD